MSRRLLVLRIAFFCCAAAVLYLALSVRPPPVTSGWDKGNHVLAFAVLGLLAFSGWPRRLRPIFLALLAYGLAIEVLQALTPHREADWRDVIADAVGLLLASGAREVIRWRQR